jgi:hypothetical protein
MQKPQLQQDKEQENDNRTDRDEEILPVLPQASTASGNKVRPGTTVRTEAFPLW